VFDTTTFGSTPFSKGRRALLKKDSGANPQKFGVLDPGEDPIFFRSPNAKM